MSREIQATRKPVIDPKELIAELTLEELNGLSDDYYQRLPLPEYQMAKPFSMVAETGEILTLLGMLLQGLRMRPGLRVLDFGAGTCWLSKMIWQMGCSVVALDVSPRALDMGRRLWKDFPVPLPPPTTIEFLPYDGQTIALPDASVDRILCFDAFHHVPNPDQVLAEMARILAPGGLIGMSEPLGAHSSTAESQREMRVYGVLENDIDFEGLCRQLRDRGLEGPRFRAHTLPELELDLTERAAAIGGGPLPKRLEDSCRDALRSSGVFFFSRPGEVLDSRSPKGLRHVIRPHRDRIVMQAGGVSIARVTVSNTGEARWLKGGIAEIGTVNVGSQLFDAQGNLLRMDLTRGALPRALEPGESIDVDVPLLIDQPGHYRIGFDMVSELVTWFAIGGSELAFIEAEVL